MRPVNYSNLLLLAVLFILSGCQAGSKAETQTESSGIASYQGTASVSQGGANVLVANIYDCDRGRKAPLGTATAADGSTWTVPAEVNFDNDEFPFASDLYNPCTGVEFSNAQEALSALDGADIVEIEPDGELVTAYVFADNYFEMYINGIAAGKDNVPFTQFNSNLVRFRVNRPFTVAVKCVDWEENSGLGTEANRGNSHHPGDGGFVAVFKSADGGTVAVTDENWKAQIFYTAPIADLSCPAEQGALRLSENCSSAGAEDYALHWEVPANWYSADFDDSGWPAASTYTNDVIGVDNKPSYTNFTDIFDDQASDASFIWSANVVLDNEVIVRYTVE
ncbi:hypothetical protein FUA23_18265 [Neolewinella aurantiaca]|uniref:Uncharacterized protein n=1 Tax=Neolewinella aurantiaca TaxID=2602767 RepID=A0A5C7FMN3_9BACT|nr:hypothetical protein [Neolewinella aurantiaca]TXF87644.1 hypothetical protein FUA23_18265 [Neolewinella aurantiaca]